MISNIPEIVLGLVAVSRDCFPLELSQSRRNKVYEECQKLALPVIEIRTIVEKEADVQNVLEEVKA
ncbi:MAG: fucose isomerase, partial [Candidatus Aminicenantes bacterium]